MQDTTHNTWDIRIKVVGVVGAFIAFSFGLYQYYDSNRKAFRKPVWERQVSLYFDASRAASIIATQSSGKDLESAKAAFLSLYYGELCIVEDNSVIGEMIDFKKLVDRLEREPDMPRKVLQDASIELAHACRHSISDTWSVELQSLDSRYNKQQETKPPK